MRKWIALLIVLPVIGCGPKGDPAEETSGNSDPANGANASVPSDPDEVAEAREYIDQALVHYDLAKAGSTTPEEEEAIKSMLEELTESLKTWKSDFDERPLMSRFSAAANKNVLISDQQDKLRVEFQALFGSESMNYEYQTLLDDALKSYVEVTDRDAHDEATALMAPFDDIQERTLTFDLMTSAGVAMSKAMKIYLAVMAEHGGDMTGSAEDGLFTELDLDYLNRFYSMQIEFADNLVLLVGALEEMTEAQTGWK